MNRVAHYFFKKPSASIFTLDDKMSHIMIGGNYAAHSHHETDIKGGFDQAY